MKKISLEIKGKLKLAAEAGAESCPTGHTGNPDWLSTLETALRENKILEPFVLATGWFRLESDRLTANEDAEFDTEGVVAVIDDLLP